MPLTCFQCNEKFHDSKNFAKHLLDEHYCYGCLADFSSERSYWLHCLFKHSGIKPSCSMDVICQLSDFVLEFLQSSNVDPFANQENFKTFLSKLWTKFIESTLARSGQLSWLKPKPASSDFIVKPLCGSLTPTTNISLDISSSDKTPDRTVELSSQTVQDFVNKSICHKNNAATGDDVTGEVIDRGIALESNNYQEILKTNIKSELGLEENFETPSSLAHSSSDVVTSFGVSAPAWTVVVGGASSLSNKSYRIRKRISRYQRNPPSVSNNVVKKQSLFINSKGAKKCQLCGHLADVKNNWRLHVFKHIRETTTLDWLYKCLLCLESQAFHTFHEISLRRHMDDKHGKKFGAAQKGVDYAEADSAAEIFNRTELMCFPPLT